MGFHMPDVYNQPEVFGLELVGSIDWADAYEFDIVAVFRKPETGEWFYGQDAGCSCPSPFEGFTSLFDLTVASRAKIQQVLEAKNNDEASHYRPKDRSMDVAALLERMWAL